MSSRPIVALVAAVAFVGAAPPAASAADPPADYVTIPVHWRNCQTERAGLSLTAKWNAVGRNFGKGTYMIKVIIDWQRPNFAGGWTTEDHATRDTGWIGAKEGGRAAIRIHTGDTTSWGAAYGGNWRSHVKIQLRKKHGPASTQVGLSEYYLKKAAFAEQETGICSVSA